MDWRNTQSLGGDKDITCTSNNPIVIKPATRLFALPVKHTETIYIQVNNSISNKRGIWVNFTYVQLYATLETDITINDRTTDRTAPQIPHNGISKKLKTIEDKPP